MIWAVSVVRRMKKPSLTRSETLTEPTEIICALGTSVYWIDYVPRRVLCVVKTQLFGAVSMDDGSLVIYSPQGRRYGHFAAIKRGLTPCGSQVTPNDIA